jgi:acyl carrier protein
MIAHDVEQRVLQIFLDIAPDVDPAILDRAAAFRDQFDFDSMDTLNFAIALHQAFGIDVPETDYRELAGLNRAVAYVQRQLAAPKPAPLHSSGPQQHPGREHE